MNTKSNCKHKPSFRIVLFRDSTKHIAKQCTVCNKHLGFASRAEAGEFEKLDTGFTERKKREDLGMPVGCRSCGASTAKMSGCCQECEKAGKHRILRRYAKDLQVRVWDLSKEQLFELWEKEG